MYDLSGKVALVTGTSNKRGLGCGIALRLARDGANVVVNDKYRAPENPDPRDREEGWRGLDSVVKEIEALGCQALAITADVSNNSEVNDMVEKAVERFGKIDILVNNAGVLGSTMGPIPIVDLTEEDWARVLAINLTGVFLMCKAVAKQMIKQGYGGRIINISSVAGKRGNAGEGAYCASKAGVISLTQVLAQELGRYNINVNAVCPGMIATWGSRGKKIYEAMKQGLGEDEAIMKVYADTGRLQFIPLGRPGNVEEPANMVAFLASNQSDYMTGQAINVCGGWLTAR